MDLRLLATDEASDAGVDELHEPGDGSGGDFQCCLLCVLGTEDVSWTGGGYNA